MLFLNKPILIHNLNSLCDILKGKSVKTPCCFYADRFAVNYKIENNTYTYRVWKTKSFFDIWYTDFLSGSNFIAALDYSEKEDYIQIDYININDHRYRGWDSNEKDKLSDIESRELMGSMIENVKKHAKKTNKNKIILSVHNNLINYDKYFIYFGFNLTNRKDKENPFWIESELIVSDTMDSPPSGGT